ncbi:hypothetical protein TRVL_09591 [Trypanosoma vivax]|nr:hypothetical protein TRVL_09591 [Trypanosoma vivax]
MKRPCFKPTREATKRQSKQKQDQSTQDRKASSFHKDRGQIVTEALWSSLPKHLRRSPRRSQPKDMKAHVAGQVRVQGTRSYNSCGVCALSQDEARATEPSDRRSTFADSMALC